MIIKLDRIPLVNLARLLKFVDSKNNEVKVHGREDPLAVVKVKKTGEAVLNEAIASVAIVIPDNIVDYPTPLYFLLEVVKSLRIFSDGKIPDERPIDLESIREIEKESIKKTLKEMSGDIDETARVLGMKEISIGNKIK